jgi:L-lactate dehydrogenase complex protein LldG
MSNPVIENVRTSLADAGRSTPARQRPVIFPARQPGSMDSEIGQFLTEIKKLSGVGLLLQQKEIRDALETLIRTQNIHSATVWDTAWLNELGISALLNELGVKCVSPNANKHQMASCDLGITEADYLLPETGTLVLKSSQEKPRAVSLLPRIHLAIVQPESLRADLHQVFAEVQNPGGLCPYLVFITGPSRTADIELTVTLGVHGPKSLFVWMIKG